MAVEPRDGTLHVYMPPIKLAEDYLALIAAVEAAAESLQFEVRMEGYEPPTDVRLNALRITPDPGVIEVNIHPVAQWEELVANTTAVSEDARETRLGDRKVDARRPPHRHGRRQSRDAGRQHARRQRGKTAARLVLLIGAAQQGAVGGRDAAQRT